MAFFGLAICFKKWYNIYSKGKPDATKNGRKRDKKMTIESITFEKYVEIANLLDECVGDVYLYGIEEIAVMCDVPVEVVKYVDRAEHE